MHGRTDCKPSAQAFASSSRLRSLRACNEALDGIQARLEGYLAQKRRAFPRFHFISNPELLSVLSHTRDPSATQPHMRKLFEGAERLDLRGEGRTLDVLAMVSAQHEHLPLGKTLKARGAPEGTLLRCMPWLGGRAQPHKAVRHLWSGAIFAVSGGNRLRVFLILANATSSCPCVHVQADRDARSMRCCGSRSTVGIRRNARWHHHQMSI